MTVSDSHSPKSISAKSHPAQSHPAKSSAAKSSAREQAQARAKTLPRAVGGLLSASRQGLADAEGARVSGERYALAHLAALRAAAAVLAARTRPQSRRGRPVSAWRLLQDVAPELGEWAAFFAAGASKRAAAEAGRPVVSQREADDLIRDAEHFLLAVLALLGLVQQPSLSLSA